MSPWPGLLSGSQKLKLICDQLEAEATECHHDLKLAETGFGNLFQLPLACNEGRQAYGVARYLRDCLYIF